MSDVHPPAAESLNRKELQSYLKQWGLPAKGTTVALRATYEQRRLGKGSISDVAVVVDAYHSSPAVANRKPKAGKQQAPEKRLKRFRSSCPMKVMDRIQRAMTQRLYLIKKSEVSEDLKCDFVVLGSTGNVYNVSISKLPSCNCPDHAKGNHPCKHILFVFIKVIGLSSSSPYIYQNALLTSELREIFGQMQARRVGGMNVMAKASVCDKYAKIETGDDNDDTSAQQKSLEQDADCPICFDPMTSNLVTYCRSTCGTNFHKDCIRRWLQHNDKCPNCRQPWQSEQHKSNVGSEGYTNLASLQGQSLVRDTSTYSDGYLYYRNKKGRYYY